MSGERELSPVLGSLGVAVASGLGPVLAAIAWGLFARSEEQTWIAFTMVLGAPASAVAGLVAAAIVYTSARPASAWRVWLLTTAAAGVGGPLLLVARAKASGFPVAAADVASLLPMLVAAAIGALPPAWLAVCLRRAALAGRGAEPRG